MTRLYGVPVEERFWCRVEKRGPDECWLWTGTLHKGYGNFRARSSDRGSIGAHRFAYELHTGRTIPVGMTIDHLCRVKNCVNPAHLEVVTQAENSRRNRGHIKRQRPTECKYGHPFDAANTIVLKDGYRRCRECSNRRTRDWHRAGKRRPRVWDPSTKRMVNAS